MYADEMVLLSPTAEGPQEKLNLLYFKDWCLKVNTQKTKVIVFNGPGKHSNLPFSIDNNNIECVKHYRYLGLTINTSGTLSGAEIVLQQSQNSLLQTYKKMYFLTFNPSIKTALNIFDHTIKPIIL
jgi:hypothetical protein